MSILLFEPHLRSFTGHYNRYVRVIATEAARRGFRVCVASSMQIETQIKSALEAMGIEILPVFPSFPYHLEPDRDQQHRIAHTFCEVAWSCFNSKSTCKVAWLSGTASLLESAALFAERARVPFPLQIIDFSRAWPAGDLTAPSHIREALTMAASHGLRLYAQTDLVARVAARELGLEVLAFPPILDLKPLRSPRKNKRPVLGLMNMLNSLKDIEAALPPIIAHSDRFSIVLQLDAGGQKTQALKSDVQRLLHHFRIADPQISCVPWVLTAESYNAVWQSLDCVVMPYNVEHYARRGSGTLFESLADAIIPVAPEGTSMAVLIREAGVGLTYQADDKQALHRALAELDTDFERFAKRSRNYAPLWRQKNAPSKVLDVLEQAWGGR